MPKSMKQCKNTRKYESIHDKFCVFIPVNIFDMNNFHKEILNMYIGYLIFLGLQLGNLSLIKKVTNI